LIYPSPDEGELADAIRTSYIQVLTHPNRERARVRVEVPRRVRKGWTETEVSVRLAERHVKEAGANYDGGGELAGKVALVTAASKGIGAGIATC